MSKPGRNDDCPCGSGKKYKHCCLRQGANDPFGRRAAPAPPPAAPFTRSLRGTVFTPAAALAVSRGADLGVYELHPWVVAQLRERTGIGNGGGRAVWTISRVRREDTDTLLARLARLGTPMDRERFQTYLDERYASAWDVSHLWPGSEPDRELLGLIACELWRRWAPVDLPSLEMIDEQMQDGYDALERGDRRGACVLWLDVWGVLLEEIPQATSLAELDAELQTGFNTIGNWFGDVTVELSSQVGDDRALGVEARDVFIQVAQHITDTRVHRFLAELHLALGEFAEAEALLLGLLRDQPDDTFAAHLLAESLARRDNRSLPELHRHPATQALTAQCDAWNAGSIEGYLVGCAPDVVYITARGPAFGRDALAATLAAAYPDRATMGTLALVVLRLDAAGDPDVDGASACVTLHWTVTRPGAPLGGHALVVLRRIEGTWLMTHDATLAG